ncbi:hypothetical protein KA005_79855 [bacterium]|nr:hypothetical protein [bacterium]
MAHNDNGREYRELYGDRYRNGSEQWGYNNARDSYTDYYSEPYYEDPEVEPLDYEPHDRFERERYSHSRPYYDDPDGEMEPEEYQRKSISFQLPKHPFQNSGYNEKIPIMQLTATAALIVIFLLNYAFNEGYVEALSRFSPLYVGSHPPIIAAVLGGLFGYFMVVFPSMGKDFKRTIIIGTIVILIFFFSAAPLVALFATTDAVEVGRAFARTLLEFIKIFAVLLYWAPVMLGVYGIWARKGLFIGISAMFLFFTIILFDGMLLYFGLPMTKSFNNWPVYVLFALALFCFIEMADSAINFSSISESTPYSQDNHTYENHLNRILQVYFVYFIVFAVLIFIITGVIFSFEGVSKAFGSEQIAESLEIKSIYGITFALIIITLIILIFGIFLRHEITIRNYLEKLFLGKHVPDGSEDRKDGTVYSTQELSSYWPSAGTMSKPSTEGEPEEETYF